VNWLYGFKILNPYNFPQYDIIQKVLWGKRADKKKYFDCNKFSSEYNIIYAKNDDKFEKFKERQS